MSPEWRRTREGRAGGLTEKEDETYEGGIRHHSSVAASGHKPECGSVATASHSLRRGGPAILLRAAPL